MSMYDSVYSSVLFVWQGYRYYTVHTVPGTVPVRYRYVKKTYLAN